MKDTLEITVEDIVEAKKRYAVGDICAHCPTAIAAQRKFNDKSISVNFTTIHGKSVYAYLSEELQRNVVNPATMSRWLDIKPGTYEIEVVENL